jgi:hypothetical protein
MPEIIAALLYAVWILGLIRLWNETGIPCPQSAPGQFVLRPRTGWGVR